MNAQQLAVRKAQSHDRLMSAMEQLAEKYDARNEYEQVQAASSAPARDPEVKNLLEAEAMADLLESIAADTGAGGGIEDLDGIGPDITEDLAASGVNTREDLEEASDETLLAVPGIGPARLKKIRAGLK